MGLRNAKLRISRKLIFASGLLLCYGCNLDKDLRTRISTEKDAIRLNLVNHIREQVRLTPLEIVTRSLRAYDVPRRIQGDFFSSYASFLDLLDDADTRKNLQNLRAVDSRNDPDFKRVREISRLFERCLDHIFFENDHLKLLTRKYGLF